jgi:hypothetical protein
MAIRRKTRPVATNPGPNIRIGVGPTQTGARPAAYLCSTCCTVRRHARRVHGADRALDPGAALWYDIRAAITARTRQTR